jgi:hypothetical protein
MHSRNFFLTVTLLLISCFLGFFNSHTLQAVGQKHEYKKIVKIESRQRPVIQAKGRVRMTHIRDARGDIIGMEYFRDHQRYVNIGDKEFPVVDVNHILVSSDRQVILKYGQAGDIHEEFKTDLYWYNTGGELVRKIVGKYRYLRVAMSPDGYVAVCGKERDKKGAAITIFGRKGSLMTPSVPMPPPRACFGIAISKGGGSVALITVKSSGNWDKKADLVIYTPRGERSVLERDIIYPQGLFISEDGKYLLAPGKNKVVLVDFTSRRLLWTYSRFLRMANRYAFNIDKDRNLVLLNAVSLDTKKPQKGLLTLNLLSLTKGIKVFEIVIPEIDISAIPRASIDAEGNLLVRTDRMDFRYKIEKVQQ